MINKTLSIQSDESLYYKISHVHIHSIVYPNYPLDRFSAIDALVGWAELTDPVNYKIGGHVDFIIIFFFNAFENNEGHGHRHR